MDEVEYEEEGLAESLLDENAIASLPSESSRHGREHSHTLPLCIACCTTFVYRTRDFLAGGNKREWYQSGGSSPQPVWPSPQWLPAPWYCHWEAGHSGAGTEDSSHSTDSPARDQCFWETCSDGNGERGIKTNENFCMNLFAVHRVSRCQAARERAGK